jgi:translocator protein
MTTASSAQPRTRAHGPRSAIVLVGLLALCVGGGALIGVTFAGQTETYQELSLPAWAPPSWLFGPAWTILYTLMAVSAWVVWRTEHPLRNRALVAFAVQLVLNFAWTPVFFGADELRLGLGTIVAVLLAAGWWTFEAARVHRLAGVLQLPYLAWLSFATALNTAIVLANP